MWKNVKNPIATFFPRNKNLYRYIYIQGRRKGGGGIALQFWANQLTLFQPGGADYARHINTVSPPQIFVPYAASDILLSLVFPTLFLFQEEMTVKTVWLHSLKPY